MFARCHQGTVGRPGHAAQPFLAGLALDAGDELQVQVGQPKYGDHGKVGKAQGKALPVGTHGRIAGTARYAHGLALNQMVRGVIDPQRTIQRGGHEPAAGRSGRDVHHVAAIFGIAGNLAKRGSVQDAQPAFTLHANHEMAPVRCVAERGHQPRESAHAPDQCPGFGIENVHRCRLVPLPTGPAADRDVPTVGRYRCGEQDAFIAGLDRDAQGAYQAKLRKLPDAHSLVVPRCDGAIAHPIQVEKRDGQNVGAGFDAQDGCRRRFPSVGQGGHSQRQHNEGDRPETLRNDHGALGSSRCSARSAHTGLR